MDHRLLELVKERTAKFVHYRDGNFIYVVDGFHFPIPLSDIGTATLLAEDKALFFMRWIRAQLKTLETEKILCSKQSPSS